MFLNLFFLLDMISRYICGLFPIGQVAYKTVDGLPRLCVMDWLEYSTLRASHEPCTLVTLDNRCAVTLLDFTSTYVTLSMQHPEGADGAAIRK
jgi:hypothetical protein